MLKCFCKNKKGNIILDGITIIVVLIFLVVVVNLLWSSLYKEFIPDVQKEVQTAQGRNALEVQRNAYPKSMDYGVVFLLIAMWIAVLISASKLDTSPAFFIIVAIVYSIVLMCSIYLSVEFQDFINDYGFEDMETEFPITYFALSHLLAIMILIGATGAAVLYAKNTL